MRKSALLIVPVAVAIVIGAAVGGCRDVSFRLANRTGTEAGGGAPGGPGGGSDASFGGRGGGGVGAGGAIMATGGQSGGGAGGATAIGAGGAGQPACTDPLTFADPDVEAQVRQAIGVPTGPIHPADVGGLTDLLLLLPGVPFQVPPSLCGGSRNSYLPPHSADSMITSLSGIECIPSIRSVALDPLCVDLGPLANLPNLNDLYFGPTLETNIPSLPGVTVLESVAAAPDNTAAILLALPSLKSIGTGALDFSTADARAALFGLQNLTDLALLDQTDISFISGLNRLTSLSLRGSIQDISPLSGLTGLKSLDLSQNQIGSVSPLQGLSELMSLNLAFNEFRDISALGGLTQLTSLDVSSNQVEDISALSGLVGLVHLVLDNNPISDVAALVANPGLGTGDDVSIIYANLNCAQQQKNIAALRSRGVTLMTDCP